MFIKLLLPKSLGLNLRPGDIVIQLSELCQTSTTLHINLLVAIIGMFAIVEKVYVIALCVLRMVISIGCHLHACLDR